jgi:hypothetical protein
MLVNSNVGLRINMTFTDVVNQIDGFRITFPTGSVVSFVNVSGTAIFTTPSLSGMVFTVNQNTLLLKTYTKGSSYIINFYSYKAPPSTKRTDPIVV